jgi:hypothetical protein
MTPRCISPYLILDRAGGNLNVTSKDGSPIGSVDCVRPDEIGAGVGNALQNFTERC